jgi:hypothetical protein
LEGTSSRNQASQKPTQMSHPKACKGQLGALNRNRLDSYIALGSCIAQE